MATVIYGDHEVEVDGARWRDGDVWVPLSALPMATGWEVRPEGVCAGDTCVPLPAGATWSDEEAFNLSAFARHLGMAEAADAAVAGEGIVAFVPADQRGGAASTLAPDFTLPDLDGNLHSLSDHRGEKVVLLTWASFCGCRFDLPGWQAVYEELKSERFTVLAVAQDAGGAETTRPWIRPPSMEEQYPQPILDLMGWDADAWRGAAPPQYPCLIDERHQVSLLYGMVNVPTAVWIDEEGRIVRPPEPAGVTEAFKAIDLPTFSMPPEAIEAGSSNRNRYLAAVRDWVRRGADSPAVLPPEEVQRRMGGADADLAPAAAHFRLAQAIYKRKGLEAARPHFAEAARLRPESWTYQRQARQLADPAAVGELDAGPDFWAALDARGEGGFYPPIELPETV